MKKLSEVNITFIPENDDEMADLIRIQCAIFSFRGIYCSLEECSDIWCRYSQSVYASWIFTPKKMSDIISHIESDVEFTNYENYLTYLR
jgi:SH3-like domain-containing protein